MSNERPGLPSGQGVVYTTPSLKSKEKRRGRSGGAPAYRRRKGGLVQPLRLTLPDLDEDPEDREDDEPDLPEEDERPEDEPLERGALTDRPDEEPDDRGAL